MQKKFIRKIDLLVSNIWTQFKRWKRTNWQIKKITRIPRGFKRTLKHRSQISIHCRVKASGLIARQSGPVSWNENGERERERERRVLEDVVKARHKRFILPERWPCRPSIRSLWAVRSLSFSLLSFPLPSLSLSPPRILLPTVSFFHSSRQFLRLFRGEHGEKGWRRRLVETIKRQALLVKCNCY